MFKQKGPKRKMDTKPDGKTLQKANLITKLNPNMKAGNRC